MYVLFTPISQLHECNLYNQVTCTSNLAPDKQAKMFGGDNFQVTFQALKERRTNVLERRTSFAERKKSHMETLKGPLPPMNGNGMDTLVPASAPKTRGKAPKPKVTNIDFSQNGTLGGLSGSINQVFTF